MSKRSGWLALCSIFGSTFFELAAYFMLLPMLLLQLKAHGVSTATAGLFAATSWAGVFLATPFASAIANRLGRRSTLWLAAAIPTAASVGFVLTDNLPIWFMLELVAGVASGLRWVLAEAVVAEFSPPGQRGRYAGIFEAMVASTFIIGPAVLVWVGTHNPAAKGVVIVLFALGLASSALIPRLPEEPRAHPMTVGVHGVWRALKAHPMIMFVGFLSGLFESGITSVLPLYGLTMGLGSSSSISLISTSGMGGALTALPLGMLADGWAKQAASRRAMMTMLSAIILLSTCVVPFTTHIAWLAWPTVCIWGGAGGCMYTLAMIDIGSLERGMKLVNSTAVLVMTYTLGGIVGSSASGALLQGWPASGFPILLSGAALLGLLVLCAPGLLARARCGSPVTVWP